MRFIVFNEIAACFVYVPGRNLFLLLLHFVFRDVLCCVVELGHVNSVFVASCFLACFRALFVLFVVTVVVRARCVGCQRCVE